MAYLLKTFIGGINSSQADVSAAMTTWFAANPGRLVDVIMTRKSEQRSSGALVVRVVVQTGVPAPVYVVASIQGSDSSDLSTVYDTLVAANPAYVLVRALRSDATQERSLSRGRLLAIFATTSAPESSQVYVAAPTAILTSGGSVTMSLIDGTNTVVGTSTVKNTSAGSWPAGQRSAVVWHDLQGSWIGTVPT